MRRLSMKSKRRKSETVSNNSEENGVTTRTATSEDDSEVNEKKEESGTATESTTPSRKSAGKKRSLRASGRHSQKAHSEESTQDDGSSNEQEDVQQAEEQENGNIKAGPKRRKKEDHKASTSAQEKAAGGDHEYEVENIVGHRTIKGRRQFLVRWKGYGEDSDTWEHEKDLNCPKLIEDFLADDTENEQTSEKTNNSKAAKLTKSPKTEKKTKKTKNNMKKETENDDPMPENEVKNEKDSQKEFEVEKILEVHIKKNKGREFLIRWKGYTAADDTWEPEENLNCPELIAKFMQKVDKVKSTDTRKLRTNPAHTKRYTSPIREHGRRSRRNLDKPRATYQETDE